MKFTLHVQGIQNERQQKLNGKNITIEKFWPEKSRNNKIWCVDESCEKHSENKFRMNYDKNK